MITLSSRVLSSSFVLLGLSVAQRSLGFISTLVLARLLTPADFGVVAVAILVVYFADILSDSGAPQFVVQVDSLDDKALTTAWTLNLILKCAIVMAIWMSLPLLKLYWPEETIQPVFLLAPIIVLKALQSPQLLLDRRNLNYGRIFKVRVGQKIIAFLCSVGFAWYLGSYWAIVIADIISNCAAVALSYVWCRGVPRFGLMNVHSQWIFSRWMLLRGGFGYLRAQIDTIIAASVFPLDALGRYNMARELTVMPSTLILMPMLEPLLVSFSRSRDNAKMLHRQISLTLILLITVTLPAALFLARYANALVITLLGDQWKGAVPIVVALSPVLLFFPIGGVMNSLLVSQGKLRMLFFYDLVSLSLLGLTLSVVMNEGLIIFAGWRATIGVLSSFTLLILASRVIRFNLRTFLSALRLPVSASFFSIMVLEILPLPTGPNMIIFSGVFYIIIYMLSLFFSSRLKIMRSNSWAELEGMVTPQISNIYVRAIALLNGRKRS